MSSSDSVENTTRIAQPIHLTVKRNSKGRVEYEISIYAATVEEEAMLTFELEDKIKARYAGQLAGEEEPK